MKTELEENKGSTENMEFKSIDTEDLKKSPRPDREKCLPHIEELEKKVKMMSTVINILDSQMSSKDKQLQRNNAEILLLKSKLSDCNFAFNRARHSSQKDFQVKIPQSEPIHPDILNFFTCIAGALESLL